MRVLRSCSCGGSPLSLPRISIRQRGTISPTLATFAPGFCCRLRSGRSARATSSAAHGERFTACCCEGHAALPCSRWAVAGGECRWRGVPPPRRAEAELRPGRKLLSWRSGPLTLHVSLHDAPPHSPLDGHKLLPAAPVSPRQKLGGGGAGGPGSGGRANRASVLAEVEGGGVQDRPPSDPDTRTIVAADAGGGEVEATARLDGHAVPLVGDHQQPRQRAPRLVAHQHPCAPPARSCAARACTSHAHVAARSASTHAAGGHRRAGWTRRCRPRRRTKTPRRRAPAGRVRAQQRGAGACGGGQEGAWRPNWALWSSALSREVHLVAGPRSTMPPPPLSVTSLHRSSSAAQSAISPCSALAQRALPSTEAAHPRSSTPAPPLPSLCTLSRRMHTTWASGGDRAAVSARFAARSAQD